MTKSIVWERKSIHLKWQQSHIKIVEQLGIHVDRGILDQELLKLAQSHGATIYQPISQLNVVKNQTGWMISYIYKNKQIHIRVPFVVDATGRGGTLFKKKSIKFQPNLLAIHAIWSMKNQPPTDGYMEALPDAWSWGAYLGNNKLLLSIYTDASVLKNQKTSIESYYLDKIKQIESLSNVQLEALNSKIEVCDATSHYQENVISDKYIKIGDAAFTVDPLSSQGVFLALSSAFCVSRVIRTILDPTKDTSLAKTFYENLINDRVENFKERIPYEYHKVNYFANNPFWKERSKVHKESEMAQDISTLVCDLSQPYIFNPGVKITTVPILGDNYIEQSRAISLKNNRPIAFVNGVSIIEFLGNYKVNGELCYDFSEENEADKVEIIKHLIENGFLEFVIKNTQKKQSVNSNLGSLLEKNINNHINI